MVNWCSLITISLTFSACQALQPRDEIAEEIMHGTINYPFPKTERLGTNGPKDKFVIRSIKGNTEYVIEFPDSGRDYDIEVPIAELNDGNEELKREINASKTDLEQTQMLPDVADKDREKTNLIDSAFGVAKDGNIEQGPSYTLTLARASEYYRQNKLELSLIEVNNLLSYYPNSLKLLKMKGTLYKRLDDLPLAEKAWTRALELAPDDKQLKLAIAHLRDRIKANRDQNDGQAPLPTN